MKKTAHFYAYGAIGEPDPLLTLFGGEDSSISCNMVLDFINANEDAEIFAVHLKSRGGSVDEGFAIYDKFVNSGKEIQTIAEGQVASIATVIFLAGKVRQITENSTLMIHNPWIDPSSIGGMDAAAIQKMADDVKREEERIVDFYVKATGVDKPTIIDMMKDETTFDAAKALELKFATEILKPVKAFAYVKPIKTNKKMTKIAGGAKPKSFMDKVNAIYNKLMGDAGTPIELSTKDGISISVSDDDGDGIPMVGDIVTDENDAPMVSQTITLEDGSSLMTDENGAITTVTPAPAADAAAKKKIADDAKANADAKIKADADAKAAADAAAKAGTPEAQVIALTTERDAIKAERDAAKAELLGLKATQTEMEKKLNKILGSIGSEGNPKTSAFAQFVSQSQRKAVTKKSVSDYKAAIEASNHKKKVVK